jgi:hypothetical protein
MPLRSEILPACEQALTASRRQPGSREDREAQIHGAAWKHADALRFAMKARAPVRPVTCCGSAVLDAVNAPFRAFKYLQAIGREIESTMSVVVLAGGNDDQISTREKEAPR